MQIAREREERKGGGGSVCVKRLIKIIMIIQCVMPLYVRKIMLKNGWSGNESSFEEEEEEETSMPPSESKLMKVVKKRVEIGLNVCQILYVPRFNAFKIKNCINKGIRKRHFRCLPGDNFYSSFHNL